MANPRCSVLAGIVLGLSAPAAGAEPEVTQNIVTYDVSGATPAEIRASLNSARPTEQRSGRRLDATTHWHVNWRYRYFVNGQGCNITAVTTSVAITMTMPRLTSSAVMSPELARSFGAYTDKLLLHEKGHADNGIEIARRIEAAIGRHPPRPTCDELGHAVNALAEQIVRDEGGRLDAEYDERTQHGRTQGVIFP